MRTLRRPQALLLSGALALTLTLTACGGSDSPAADAGKTDSGTAAEVQEPAGTKITAADDPLTFYIPEGWAQETEDPGVSEAMSAGFEGDVTASYVAGAIAEDQEQAIIVIKVAPATELDETIATGALEAMAFTDVTTKTRTVDGADTIVAYGVMKGGEEGQEAHMHMAYAARDNATYLFVLAGSRDGTPELTAMLDSVKWEG